MVWLELLLECKLHDLPVVYYRAFKKIHQESKCKQKPFNFTTLHR